MEKIAARRRRKSSRRGRENVNWIRNSVWVFLTRHHIFFVLLLSSPSCICCRQLFIDGRPKVAIVCGPPHTHRHRRLFFLLLVAFRLTAFTAARAFASIIIIIYGFSWAMWSVPKNTIYNQLTCRRIRRMNRKRSEERWREKKRNGAAVTMIRSSLSSERTKKGKMVSMSSRVGSKI